MELEERIAELTSQKLTIGITESRTYKNYKNSLKQTKHLRKEWERARDSYEKVDFALAKLDGRLSIIPTPKPSQAGEKTPIQIKPAQMTMDQVRMLAKRVGVELKED